MVAFELIAPATEAEAIAALRALPDGEAAPLAGGTDLLLDVEMGRLAPRRLVSLRRLPWRTLDWNGGALTIGSLLPLRSIERDPEVAEHLPALAQAVGAVGGVALRARATLGGNLGRAAPASDLVPVLLALDAEVELVSPRGVRTVPVDRFVRASRTTDLGRAELIRAVRIPERRPSAYLWQRVRPVNDVSQVAVAVAYSPRDRRWRVVIGGVPPRPVRGDDPDAPLVGLPPSAADVDRTAERVARLPALVADRRASDEYRRRLAGTLVRRAVRAAVGGGTAT
ncbi:MAG TPA: FAD binding domain-containing protein [Thermoplasmata archaeon]|nr:FAD binding domain-containing protein [Thermoplasmata archaeon]